MEKLYKLDSKGRVQIWSIQVQGDSFVTTEGLLDGKHTTSKPTVCVGKNEGRSNSTTAEEQAIKEAKAKWQKKVDSGYSTSVESSGAKFFKPMLAVTIERKLVDFKNKVFIQPKLDGLRAISKNNTLTSRSGKSYNSCPHLYQNDCLLDGELYAHEYRNDFDSIVSLCKKQTPSEEELKESAEKIKHWVYDFPEVNGKFSERYAVLKKYIDSIDNDSFVLVPTYEVTSWEEIESYNDKFLELGFEGSIIRIDSTPYENKRSKQLLKYKEFVDEEFEVIGSVEGQGGRAGTVGALWVRLDKNLPYTISETNPINCCKASMKGTHNYLAEVFSNVNSYIGTDATVKYFNKTPSGSLRHPVVTKLNRTEYE